MSSSLETGKWILGDSVSYNEYFTLWQVNAGVMKLTD